MTAEHREPKLLYVAEDGEGRHFLKVQTPAGELLALPLTVAKAARLSADLDQVILALLKKPDD